MPPQTAYDQIEQLVKKFKNLSTRERQTYNEDNTRKDFILPLFQALEWNINDMREVAAEEKISRGFVDFSFHIGGIRRFVLETKRIGEDLNDPRWAQQAIDYAYHKGVTWAVLSDFEGLKIFNAEARESNPFQAQFKEFGVDEYLPRLDELWWLSRPAIQQGILDREAEKVFKKIRKTPITQSLFDNLWQWRGKLYKNLRAYNRGKLYDAKQIDEAVQRILDRLIFIRTAEDRDVETEKLVALVRELQDQNRINDLVPALNQRFRELDRVYNSQLFQPHFSEDLDMGEPTTLAEVINNLYGSPANLTSYNFAFIDADVLGRVYEQYLGYVLSEREEIEAKKTKRKSQGIYYTPTFVVKYIVQQTLGRYLQEHDYNAARNVRVLDPACGSGSFLIEAFDMLDQYLARERGQTGGERDDTHDYARRMEILTKNIFGVDKDEQAVEVAQLNLLLKALHVRDRLPKLENIRQGDSLISGTDEELAKYFGAKWKEKNPFNWQHEFPKVMADGGFDVIVGNPPYVQMSMDANLREIFGRYLIDRFGSSMGRLNTFGFFIHLGIELLRPGGRLGFIVPNTVLTMPYYRELREFMLSLCRIESIGTFDEGPFAEAVIENVVLVLQRENDAKARQDNNVLIRKISGTDIAGTIVGEVLQRDYDHSNQHVFSVRVDKGSKNLHEKIIVHADSLENLANINQAIALKGDRSASLFNRARGKDYKPVLDGRDIGRYSIEWPGIYLKYDIRRIHSCKREDIFLAIEKLLFRRVGESIVATYDNNQFYALNTLVVVTPKTPNLNLKFVLGIMNSRMMNFYFSTFLKSTKKVFSEIQARQMGQLPIRRINFDNPAEKKQHDEIVALVEEMLELQKEYAKASREKLPRADALRQRIDEVDAEIDRLVYRLYGLTDEEIRIVKGKSGD